MGERGLSLCAQVRLLPLGLPPTPGAGIWGGGGLAGIAAAGGGGLGWQRPHARARPAVTTLVTPALMPSIPPPHGPPIYNVGCRW